MEDIKLFCGIFDFIKLNKGNSYVRQTNGKNDRMYSLPFFWQPRGCIPQTPRAWKVCSTKVQQPWNTSTRTVLGLNTHKVFTWSEWKHQTRRITVNSSHSNYASFFPAIFREWVLGILHISSRKRSTVVNTQGTCRGYFQTDDSIYEGTVTTLAVMPPWTLRRHLELGMAGKGSLPDAPAHRATCSSQGRLPAAPKGW